MGEYSPDKENGKVIIELGTRVDQTAAGVNALLEQIGRVKESVPPKARIDEMKGAVERAFVFNFDEPDDILVAQRSFGF